MFGKRMVRGLLTAALLGAIVLAGWSSHATADVGSLADASIVAWGDNEYGACNVPAGYDYTQVRRGYIFGLALRSDGSLAAWGGDFEGECNVPAGNNYTRIAPGGYFGLAMRTDGSLAAWARVPTASAMSQPATTSSFSQEDTLTAWPCEATVPWSDGVGIPWARTTSRLVPTTAKSLREYILI